MLQSTVYIPKSEKLPEGERRLEDTRNKIETYGNVWKSLENARSVHR